MSLRSTVVTVVAMLALALQSAAQNDQRTFHLSFQSQHQSMWGPGPATPPAPRVITIVDPDVVKWNYSSPGYSNYDGYFWEQDTYLFGTASFGAGGRASTRGQLGLWSTLTVSDPGSVNVNYPVVPTVTFPEANSFRAGDTVEIRSSYTIDSGYAMSTVSPQFELSLDALVDLHAEASARLCVFACTTTAGTLPAIDVSSNGQFNIFKVHPGDHLETPAWLGLFTPFSGSIGVPDIATTGALQADSRTLVGSGSDPFLSLTLDLGAVAEDLFHLPPLSFDTKDYSAFVDFHGIDFHYTVLKSGVTASLQAAQRFEFDPDLKVQLQFSKPMQYYVVGENGTQGAVQNGTSADIHVGDKVVVTYPANDKQPTSITPTFRLDNQFKSKTSLQASESIQLTAGEVGVQVPDVEVFPELCTPGFCTPAVVVAGVTIVPEVCVPEICTPPVVIPSFGGSVGPLYDHTWPIGTQNLADLVNGQWQLQGFAQQTVQNAFSLDPENPIITIAQAVGTPVNMGAGRRVVPVVIDIANGGDVALSSVQLSSDLAASFAGARQIHVDELTSCTSTVDPTFDGGPQTLMLASGNSLAVGAGSRIRATVSVWPQPDPAPYVIASTDEGLSPLNTHVSASAVSTVDLAPQPVHGASDFVVFGDRWVKIDSIGNTFGEIGSNSAVEVKNGASGILAGNLRSGGYVRVAGSITADYAFAGGVVDVVGSGALTLTGNAKPFTPQPSFPITAPAFQPVTPYAGNVWLNAAETSTLTPGYYGSATLNSGSVLTLKPGTYYFERLDLLAGATVATEGSVNVIVRDRLSVGNGSEVSGTGTTRDIRIAALNTGTVEIGDRASIRGVLTAPQANVFFGKGTRLAGAVYGRTVTLGPGFTASFHKDCDQTVDHDCDGVPDCSL